MLDQAEPVQRCCAACPAPPVRSEGCDADRLGLHRTRASRVTSGARGNGAILATAAGVERTLDQGERGSERRVMQGHTSVSVPGPGGVVSQQARSWCEPTRSMRPSNSGAAAVGGPGLLLRLCLLRHTTLFFQSMNHLVPKREDSNCLEPFVFAVSGATDRSP